MIKYGDNNIGKMFFGSNSIGKAYYGSNLVFQKGGGYGPLIPSGYTRLSYIETPLNTEAYINTGIAADNNTGFEIDAVVFDEISSDPCCLFGSREATLQSDFQLTTYISSGSSFSGTLRRGTATECYDAHIPTNIRFKAKLRGNSFTIKSVEYTTSANISSGENIYLFALNNNGTASQFGHIRVYRFKLFDGTTKVLDYIPCRRDTDNVVGFYDLVDDSFVTSTGGVLCGVDLNDTNYDSAVSYIQFTGAQLVNTGVGISKGSTRVEVDCQVTGNYTSTQIIVGGGSSGGQWFGNVVHSNNGVYGVGALTGNYTSIASSTRTVFTISYGNQTAATNGTSSCTLGSPTLTTLPLRVGGGGSGENQYYSNVNIWYIKVYDGETLIRDMIPVAKDNIGYFYDRITGLLFGGIGLSSLVAVTE